MSESIPTSHQLDAALRVATVLTTEERSLASVRAGYGHLPSDGLFGTPELLDGESLLIAAGVATLNEDRLSLTSDLTAWRSHDVATARELLLVELLSNRTPAWLPIATATGDLELELVPSEAARQLEDVVTDPSRREALLLALGQKHDTAYRSAIGAIGEEVVVDECQRVLRQSGHSHLAEQVAQVSLASDALGYDITSPTLSGGVRRLEVKTMGASRIQLRLFISRNEYETGLSDRNWRLVVCRLTSEETAEILGSCRAGQLGPLVPVDSPGGEWREALLELDSNALTPGLPLDDTA